jgi:hypothetical protein
MSACRYAEVSLVNSVCQINAEETVESQIGLKEYRDKTVTVYVLTLF